MLHVLCMSLCVSQHTTHEAQFDCPTKTKADSFLVSLLRTTKKCVWFCVCSATLLNLPFYLRLNTNVSHKNVISCVFLLLLHVYYCLSLFWMITMIIISPEREKWYVFNKHFGTIMKRKSKLNHLNDPVVNVVVVFSIFSKAVENFIFSFKYLCKLAFYEY